MPTHQSRDRRRRPGNGSDRSLLRGGVVLLLAMLLAGPGSPALAIPSPELIVSSLSSLSQLGAVLSALAGGGALVAMRQRSGRSAAAARRRQRMLALLALTAAALGALNLYQWQNARETRDARLSATLTRPPRLPGQPVLDPTLKELGAAEQARHPLGLSTAEAERIVAQPEAEGYRILDIRETAEVEMGTFAAALPIRYPDLVAGGLQADGRKVLLICHNGNRSSETCQALAGKGVPCRFMVGGLERWISEGRRAGGFHRSSVLEARTMPDYANRTRLFDTPEARALIEGAGARFVDVRYPGEFAAGHLPGAISIPMRRLTTPELERAIEALPKVPIVVPCYDRRSCFFGELMGLALARKGRDFRGRYTLPWEYAPTLAPPPHVVAALAERDLGLFGRARRALARGIDGLAGEWGFLSVLLGLALLSRLLVLPFALKAERDQMTALDIEPELERLKAALADDPVRRARALRQLYRRHGLTPVRNLLALLGLPVLMLAGAAVGDAATAGGHSLTGFGPLGEPDASLLLPAVAAVILAGYVDWALARTRRQQLGVWLLLAPLTVAAMMPLPAATALYLAASALLLLLQRAIVVGLAAWKTRRRAPPANPRRLDRHGILALAAAGTSDDVGGKARRLGQLIAAGARVPPGVVLTEAFLARWSGADPAERRRLARIAARATGRGPFAVRSSASAEDGAAASHAGVYASATNVAAGDLPAAIDTVLGSYRDPRAASYAGRTNGGGRSGVVVQRMVAAEFAGVLFTRAPDAPGLALVELVEGEGEALVSGLVAPQGFRYGRRSGQPVDEGRAGARTPPIDLAPLLALGREVEALLGAPQDIEWVWAAGRFHIVQSRDITADAAGLPRPLLEEWDRVLGLAGTASPGSPALVRNELCELLPRPTPATRSLIEALHASGGSVDLACRALGLAYRVEEAAPPLFPDVFGRLYLDAGAARSRAPRIGRMHVRRLIAEAEGIERRFNDEIAPGLRARLALLAATDLERLALADLMRTITGLRQSFVRATHVEAETINILAELVLSEARAALTRGGLDPARWLVRSGTSHVEAALRQATLLLPGPRAEFLARELGHRAHLDYELAAPRHAEAPETLAAWFEAGAGPELRPPLPPGPAPLPAGEQRLVALAGRLQTLKENAKHVALIELAQLRRALLALDRRFGLGGRIFLLTLEEIEALAPAGMAAARALVAAREERAGVLAAVPPLPAELSLEMLERLSWPGRESMDSGAAGLRGTRVAGTGEASGRAFVVDAAAAEAGAALPGLAAGDILVAPFVHPAWLGEVLRSGGVVSGSGGWLSHMAIVARERDVAMVVGVEGWHRVRHGSQLRLGLDGRVSVLEPAAPPQAALASSASRVPA